MTSLFPPRESLVVTSRLGTGNWRTFFYGIVLFAKQSYSSLFACNTVYSFLYLYRYFLIDKPVELNFDFNEKTKAFGSIFGKKEKNVAKKTISSIFVRFTLSVLGENTSQIFEDRVYLFSSHVHLFRVFSQHSLTHLGPKIATFKPAHCFNRVHRVRPNPLSLFCDFKVEYFFYRGLNIHKTHAVCTEVMQNINMFMVWEFRYRKMFSFR
jgi:hypothetical protein